MAPSISMRPNLDIPSDYCIPTVTQERLPPPRGGDGRPDAGHKDGDPGHGDVLRLNPQLPPRVGASQHAHPLPVAHPHPRCPHRAQPRTGQAPVRMEVKGRFCELSAGDNCVCPLGSEKARWSQAAVNRLLRFEREDQQ